MVKHWVQTSITRAHASINSKTLVKTGAPELSINFVLLVDRKLGSGETCADGCNSVMVDHTVLSTPVNLR